MKKARFVFWFALVIRISSLTKPSVTQFYRFTTMSSHVSPYTKEKKKSSTILFPARSKGKTLGRVLQLLYFVRPYSGGPANIQGGALGPANRRK